LKCKVLHRYRKMEQSLKMMPPTSTWPQLKSQRPSQSVFKQGLLADWSLQVQIKPKL